MMITITVLNNFFVALLFLCWGSFLNVVAYRLLHGVPFFGPRSRCPHCKKIIVWYDLIPLVSWLVLRGHCRWCKTRISWLYPLIEALTLVSFWGLYWYVEPHYWLAYGILFSALIVTVRTDLEEFIILRQFTLGILPLGWIFSYLNMLPIALTASIAGSLVGFGILASIRYGYYWYAGEHGMGDGDPELLATIGAFTGPLNCWLALMIGSSLGSIIGVLQVWLFGPAARKKPLPFGPCLAIGAFIVVIFQQQILQFLSSL